jgi:hypothetical protein
MIKPCPALLQLKNYHELKLYEQLLGFSYRHHLLMCNEDVELDIGNIIIPSYLQPIWSFLSLWRPL